MLGKLGARVAKPPRKAWEYPRPTAAQASALPESSVMAVRHPIYNQWVGSCTINSSAQGLVSMSGRLWVPSVNAGYYYARLYSGLNVDMDVGAYPEAVAKMLMEMGLGSVGTHSDNPDRWRYAGNFAYIEQAKDHRVLNYYRCATVEQVKSAIHNKHAVMLAMAITETFAEISRDGMWRRPNARELGGHQMWVYGYDDNLEGGGGYGRGCFHVLQSWGAWGEQVYHTPDSYPDLGRGSWRLPYEAIAKRSESKVYDVIAYAAFDAEAGD